MVRPDSLGQAHGRHEERVHGRVRVSDAEPRVLDGNGGEMEDARKVAQGCDGCDREAVGDRPPELRRITLQKIDDLKAEGLEGIGVVGHPRDDLPGPLAPP